MILTVTLLKYTQEIKHVVHKHLYRDVHSSIFHISQKVETTKCLSMDEGTNKMWHIYTMDYYSAIETNETLIYTQHGWTLKTLGTCTLNERQMWYDSMYTKCSKQAIP